MWVEAGAAAAPLAQGEKAALYLEAKRLKKMARPYPETDRREYLDISRLDNHERTGFLPRLLDCENEIFDLTEKFLEQTRTPAELAAFQERMAEKARAVLHGIN
jgi:hypothetical protein